MTPDPETVRARLKMVDEMYDRFVGIVSDARKIPMDELRNGVADGRAHGVNRRTIRPVRCAKGPNRSRH